MSYTMKRDNRPCEVSVIVPVWRVPVSLLQLCAESLQHQSLRSLEVLWVLDGPDAEARALLEMFIRTNPCMRLFQNENNLGVSAARNIGLKHARGRWFSFMDADDEASPDLFEALLEAARRGKAPMSSCNRCRNSCVATPSAGWNRLAVLDFSRKKDMVRALLLTHNGACWARLFNRMRFGDVRFDEDLQYGEDWVFMQRIMEKADKMSWEPRALYIHRTREDSATRGKLTVAAYRNWLSAMQRRTMLARCFCVGNASATQLVAWDAWQGTNNPHARTKWTSQELHEAWKSTQKYFESIGPELTVLPWDVRAAVHYEMHSISAFGQRPRWLNRWLKYRAFSALAHLEKTSAFAGDDLPRTIPFSKEHYNI